MIYYKTDWIKLSGLSFEARESMDAYVDCR